MRKKQKANDPEPSEFAKLRQQHFPGVKFARSVLNSAGRIFKAKGEVAACKYLGSKAPGDIQPPAKCLILGESRPFEEWPAFQVSQDIQKYVYGLTETQRAELPIPNLTEAGREAWLEKTGIDTRGILAQSLNKILEYAYSVYDGVVKKVANRNAKREKKLCQINERLASEGREPEVFVPESAFKEDGHLVNPPGSKNGVNASIYCTQSDHFTLVDPTKNQNILRVLAEKTPDGKFDSYGLQPDEPLPFGERRFEIPAGEIGHIPAWQLPLVNRNKKRRRRSKRGGHHLSGSILGMLRQGSDWVVFDLRGLLRNVRWRRLAPAGITPQQLIEMFTHDPVIDPDRRMATLRFSPGVISACRQKVFKTRKAPEVISREAPVGLVSLDLGKTNPFSAKASRVVVEQNRLKAECKERWAYKDIAASLTGTQASGWREDPLLALQRRHDELEKAIHLSAVEMLSGEQRVEVREFEGQTAASTKARILAATGLSENDVPWEQVHWGSTFIADALLAKNPTSPIIWTTVKPKKGSKRAPQVRKRWDGHFVNEFRLKLTKDTREALNLRIRECKKSSDGYRALSEAKTQLTRRIRNKVLQRAQEVTETSKVIVVLEDLDMTLKLFHGKGNRPGVGWDNMFRPKSEGRWFMLGLHKAFTELAENRGALVIEVDPHRTSRTCTKCGHVDGGNRQGELFCCLKCGFRANADIEIATDNIERVALTGMSMPKPVERSSDVQTPQPARKSKRPVIIGKSGASSQVSVVV